MLKKLDDENEELKIEMELKKRCHESYNISVELATHSLASFDPMRLQAVCSLCKYILQVENKSKIAARLASEG